MAEINTVDQVEMSGLYLELRGSVRVLRCGETSKTYGLERGEGRSRFVLGCPQLPV